MVVGDSDQSIYAFRGATIRNILDFATDFPGAQTVLLEQNYRSTQTVLSAANAVISYNPNRPTKNLWSDLKAGDRIILLNRYRKSPRAEADSEAGWRKRNLCPSHRPIMATARARR